MKRRNRYGDEKTDDWRQGDGQGTITNFIQSTNFNTHYAFVGLMNLLIISKFRKDMIQDLTISYVSNGIEITLTIKDDHYDNIPYNLADMFEKVIRASNANPQIVIDNLKSSFEYD